MKIDWKRKLSSRKLWIAVAGFVSGLILAFGGAESTASTVSGCILQGASVIGYLLAEGLTDAEGVKKSGDWQGTISTSTVEIDPNFTRFDVTGGGND